MSKFTIVCNKCGQVFNGNSDYDSEMEYNNHECIENGSTLHDLTEEELIQIIKGEKQKRKLGKKRPLRKDPYNNLTDRENKLKKLIITIIFFLFSVTPVASGTCFLVGEITLGKNKKCYYDCVGGSVTVTVGGKEQCPLTIEY